MLVALPPCSALGPEHKPMVTNTNGGEFFLNVLESDGLAVVNGDYDQQKYGRGGSRTARGGGNRLGN